jgi:hypothetical protein
MQCLLFDQYKISFKSYWLSKVQATVKMDANLMVCFYAGRSKYLRLYFQDVTRTGTVGISAGFFIEFFVNHV